MGALSRPSRSPYFALALLALFTLLLQPICEAAEMQNVDCGVCCVQVDEGPPPGKVAVPATPESFAFFASSFAALPGFAWAPVRATARFGPIRACPSFHSRSSRNLS